MMAEWKFIGARRYECSACGEGIPDMPCDGASGEPLYNFCPYCGENMKKKADGEIVVRSNLYPFRVVEADRKTEPQAEREGE